MRLASLIGAVHTVVMDQRRGRKASRSRHAFAIVFLSRLGIQTADDSTILLQDIQATLAKSRRCHPIALNGGAPRNMRITCSVWLECNVARSAGPDRREDAAAARQTVVGINVQQFGIAYGRRRGAAARFQRP